MSQEQALQDTGSSVQQASHSDDAGLYSDDAPSEPVTVQHASSTTQQTLSASARQNLHPDDADLYSDDTSLTPPITPLTTPPLTPPLTPLMTPLTVMSISPGQEGSPRKLDLDSIIQILGGGTTQKSVRTGKDGQPQSSSEQEAQCADGNDDIESIEHDDDIESIEHDDVTPTTPDDMSIEDDDEVLEYTQPPPTITPKTYFTEVFFAPQGDPALIPPIPRRESQYHARQAEISELATTEPRPVPHNLYWKILRSAHAGLPVGPGVDGFYPSVRDIVETQRHVQRIPQASMAEKIRNFMKTVEEKDAVIEELKQTLADPDVAAQSTEIGTLKGSNKYLEGQIRTITFHFDAGKAKYAADLEKLQADIETANQDRQRVLALFEKYEAQIAAKDRFIVELRALAVVAAPDGTIESPTNESGIISRVNSVKVLQQTLARHEATITQLQNQIIEYHTKDMATTEADSVDRTLRAEYARDKLKIEVKELKAEVDEQRATIVFYEERLQDQEAKIQRLQLEKAQHAQNMRAAEKSIIEYTSKELALTKEKTSLSNRVKVLNEELKNRSTELKESDQQLTRERRGHAVTIIESARLKDEIQKVTHERTMLKRSLAQAGDWQQEKYNANLTSEELKQELAALKEDTARMADRYRSQIKNIEVTTRLKIKNERKEATRKRRKVQEELVALRGRALTNPSEAASEQDPDSAGAVNGGKSLEEELYGSSGPDESSPEEEAAGVLTNGNTQDHQLQNHLPHLSKHSKDKNTPQSEDDTVSSTEDENPNRAGRLRSRPLVGLSRPRLTQNIEIPRVEEQNINGAVRPEGDWPVSQQSVSDFDNEVPQGRESKAHRQRLPNLDAPLGPEEGSSAPQQRPPILNDQALKEGGFGTRRRKSPILNGHVPSVSKPRNPSSTRLDMNDQERTMTDWVREIYGGNGPPQFGGSITASSIEPSQRPGRNAVRLQSNTEASSPQDQHETPVPSGASSPPSDEAGTETGPPQELERAGNGDPEPSSSSSSAPSSPPPGRGGHGLRERRPRAPVIVTVYERVPYREGTLLGKWEPLVWFLVLLFVLANFLMFMALQVERQRWLAANEGTRQMLFSVERRGPVGTGLLTWLYDNAFLNVETSSYG
ncbi:hypothetical protein MMC27_005612 [Xylographa pallens]|nr:hypothetical protein [Xylographa pallens]